MFKPTKLKNHSFTTTANESLSFDCEDETVVSQCRAVDVRISELQKIFQAIQIEGIDEESILKYMMQLEPLTVELDKIKKELCHHFTHSLKGRHKESWLHLDFSNFSHTSPVGFVFKSGLMRWRIGNPKETRAYSDSTLINRPIFCEFLVQEPPKVQKIIMEFERAKMLIWVLSSRIRSQYSHACDLHKDHLLLKEIQTYYHSIPQ